MARKRTIHPEAFNDPELAALDGLECWLFAGLWCQADREGRLEDLPARIKIAVLPTRACDVDQMLEHLAGARAIIRYSIGARRYIQIRTFRRWQDPFSRERQSEILPPPEWRYDDTTRSWVEREDLISECGVKKEPQKGKTSSHACAPAGDPVPDLFPDPVPGGEPPKPPFVGQTADGSSEPPQNPAVEEPDSPAPSPVAGEGPGAMAPPAVSPRRRRRQSQEPGPGFEEFWSLYPRREAKQDAVSAWNWVAPDEALQGRILRALALQVLAKGWGIDRKFCPYAATWLNKRRWEDEIAPVTAGPPKHSGPGQARAAPGAKWDAISDAIRKGTTWRPTASPG